MTKKLFYLNPGAKTICCVNVDGTNPRPIVQNRSHVPDGIVVSPAGQIFWTEMGEMEGDKDDGAIYRCNIDGTDITPIIPVGKTHTPKQLTISRDRLYWCDREGMKIMTSELDGSDIHILHDRLPLSSTAQEAVKDERNHCVGITIHQNFLFWTQKGPPKGNQGRIFRSPISSSSSSSSSSSPQIETLFEGLPEPIDLETCTINGTPYLYWTDRGAPPNGNSVNRSKIGQTMGAVEVLSTGFDEAIGLAIDVDGKVLYVTDLGGSIYRLNLEGGQKTVIVQGNSEDQLTGICLADI